MVTRWIVVSWGLPVSAICCAVCSSGWWWAELLSSWLKSGQENCKDSSRQYLGVSTDSKAHKHTKRKMLCIPIFWIKYWSTIYICIDLQICASLFENEYMEHNHWELYSSYCLLLPSYQISLILKRTMAVLWKRKCLWS